MPYILGPKASAAGYRLVVYDSVGSSSTEAIAWAGLGDPGKLWVVGRKQTNGYGRRKRSWESPEGNLAASLLMMSADLGILSPRLGFVAGLALRNAIGTLPRPSAPHERPRLKWPNDVVCDGAKVAGILLETVKFLDVTGGLVIGIGVNVATAPKDLPYPATSLADCGIQATAAELFQALAEAWVDCVAVWDGGRGFPEIRERWLAAAAGVGLPISVKTGDGVVSGTFETIDEEGRLIVRADDGSALPISAGDVHFGGAATAGI